MPMGSDLLPGATLLCPRRPASQRDLKGWHWAQVLYSSQSSDSCLALAVALSPVVPSPLSHAPGSLFSWHLAVCARGLDPHPEACSLGPHLQSSVFEATSAFLVS